MPRIQPIIPPAAAFRVTTPDILRQVLLYATTATLGACLTVSRNFYEIGAPLLYQHGVHCDNSTFGFLEGLLIDTNSTPSDLQAVNLKARLLQYTKTMTIIFYNFVSHERAGAIIEELTISPTVRLETVKIAFRADQEQLSCEWCRHSYCQCSYHFEHGPEKLVLLPNFLPAISLLGSMLGYVGVLTVIVDSQCFWTYSGSDLSILAPYAPIRLRIIFTIGIDRIQWNDPGQTKPGTDANIFPPIEAMVMDTITSAITSSQCIEVYLPEPPNHQSHISRRPGSMPNTARAKELFEAYMVQQDETTEASNHSFAKVVFKSRREYLMEGVTDELDEEELSRWKSAQDWEDQVDFYDQHHSVILDQQLAELDYHANHPDPILEAQVIEEYQSNPDILLQDWEQRGVRAEELAERIDETITMALVQDLVYRHYFYNVFFPPRRSNIPTTLSVSESTTKLS